MIWGVLDDQAKDQI